MPGVEACKEQRTCWGAGREPARGVHSGSCGGRGCPWGRFLGGFLVALTYKMNTSMGGEI